MVLIESAAVACVPLGDLAPLQPPDALQLVAFAEFQVKVLVLPPVTTGGEAASVAVGSTLTVTLAGALVPPGPVQVRTYVALPDKAPVD